MRREASPQREPTSRLLILRHLLHHPLPFLVLRRQKRPAQAPLISLPRLPLGDRLDLPEALLCERAHAPKQARHVPYLPLGSALIGIRGNLYIRTQLGFKSFELLPEWSLLRICAGPTRIVRMNQQRISHPPQLGDIYP